MAMKGTTGLLAYQVPSFEVGDIVEVKICNNPRSYEEFYVRPVSRDKDWETIDKTLTIMATMGLCRQSAYNLARHPDDASGLSIVIHPQSRKYMRVRIDSETDAQGKVAIFYLDTGEKGISAMKEIWQMPDQAGNFEPVAVRCSLPIENCHPEEVSKVMERFLTLNEKTFFVRVFAIEGESHIVDLMIGTEQASFCEALLKINEGKFSSAISAELKQEIENEFMEKDGSALPSVDKSGDGSFSG